MLCEEVTVGRSITINCIGLGPEELIEGKIRQRVYQVMNRVEIVQEIEKAYKQGNYIVSWYAQTKTGKRVLGGSWDVPTNEIKLPKLVTCPVCQGEGNWSLGKGLKHFCVICNGSGLCKKGNEKKWQSWQIESMKKEYSDYQRSSK